jgi:putative phosphoribosyl transferase
MADFLDLRDAGEKLAPHVRDRVTDPLVLAVAPHGIPVAEAVAAALGTSVHALEIARTDEGVSIPEIPEVSGREVVVVDDGVETGTAARAIAHALRTGNPARLVLAVPVCPRQEGGSLALLYDEVIAVVQPLARRSLRWHYANADWLD